MQRRISLGHRAALSLTVAVLILVGCEQASRPRAEPKLPKVAVVVAEKRDVPIEVRGVGTTRALQEVTIRARVSGFLDKGPPELYEEGRDVKKGQPLLEIDKRTYEATQKAALSKVEEAKAKKKAADESKTVDISQARLEVSKATRDFTQVQFNRSNALFQRNAITREEFDEKRTELAKAQADVLTKNADLAQSNVDLVTNRDLATATLDEAQAALETAKLNLSFCSMEAPIDGRIGELQIKLGNYVSGGAVEGTPLVTIQQLDPMGVDFQVSSRFLPEVQSLVDKGLMVNLIVQGDRPYPYQAKVFFSDNRVDPNTSTFLVRASVPNPDKRLLPGDYVGTNSIVGEYTGMVVVPEEAIVARQEGSVVFKVDDQGTVSTALVKVVDEFHGLRVIESGLEPGEKVIVEGLQMVRPGQKVEAEARGLKSFERTVLPTAPTSLGPLPDARKKAVRALTAPGGPKKAEPQPEPAQKPEVQPGPAKKPNSQP